jgi:beta-glucanase (GH16 family)
MLAVVAGALLAGALGATQVAFDAPMAAPAGAPSWADEFDGPLLDPTKWSAETDRNRDGWYNHEAQYYAHADRPQNLRLEGGRLILEARRDGRELRGAADYGGQAYTSGRISTAGHAAFTYGFYEVRAKLACGRGAWPAIWLLPEGSASWPDGGEIDVMELVGFQPDVVHATLHTKLFNHALGTQRGAEHRLSDACTAFHRYQLDWRPDAITVGVDDRAYMRVRNDQPGGRGAWPFDAPFHLILNLAVGGDWGGRHGIDDTAFPQRMEVDYVRVWTRPR